MLAGPLVALASFVLVMAGCEALQPRSDGPASYSIPASPVAAPNSPVPVGMPQFPSISPDGTTIVFSWAGDLWSADASGGTAQRLTVHPADEDRSAFSPDGTMLAFESERDGPRNLYVMPIQGRGSALAGGPIRRVTASDRPQALSGFSNDGKFLLFSSTHEPSIYRAARPYRVPVAEAVTPPSAEAAGAPAPAPTSRGSAPIERLCDAYGSLPRMAADGSFFTVARGRADWTRPIYVGSGSSDVYRVVPARAGKPADGANAGDAAHAAPPATFTRLTSHVATDGDAFPRPDGSVMFLSSRSGQNNLWLLAAGKTDADAGALRQLTRFAPEPGQLTIGHGVRDPNLSADGRFAVFAVWDTLFTLDLTDPAAAPRPVPLAAGADSASLEFQRMNLGKQVNEAALSPDGKTVAVIARGEVFVRNTEKDRPTRRVTDTPARERDLAWSPDGRVLYFSSDASGVYGIYQATVTLAREDVDDKPAKAPAVKAPEAKPDAKPDPAPAEPTKPTQPDPKPPPLPDPLHNEPAKAPAPAAPGPTGAPAPTGAPGATGGPSTAGPPDQPTDKPDKPADDTKKPGDDPKKPAEKPKKPDYGKRWSESLRFTVEPLAVGPIEQRTPVPSQDGTKLLYTRGLGDLILRDLATGGERVLLKSWTEPAPIWAPDSRHIIYELSDLNFNDDIWLMDTGADEGSDAAKPINLTRHPDSDGSPHLSADGKVLVFLSDRDADSNGDSSVYAVNLDRKLDGLRPYELAEYYKDAAEKAKKRKPLGSAAADAKPKAGKAGEDEGKDAKEDAAPKPDPKAGDKPTEKPGDKAADKGEKTDKPEPLTFDADDAYQRIRRITTLPGRQGNLEILPGGDRIVFSASIDAAPGLYSVDYAGKERKTIQAGAASSVTVSLTGDRVLYVQAGEPVLGKPAGGEAERLTIEAPVTIDIAAQQRQKFLEAAEILGDRFYHPTLKGLDWAGLTKRYLSIALRTRTDGEFNRVFLALLGELNGSHVGIASRGGEGGGQGQPIGYLGVDAKPAPGGYEIVRIVAKSPADRPTSRLQAGDLITSVGSTPLARADAMPVIDFNAAMIGTAGIETLVEVRRGPEKAARLVLLTPMSMGEDIARRYEDEVARNRKRVEDLSGGRLGYLHIRSMDEASVRDYERELFAAAEGKDGLIIDVRDNGGGSTADILLSSLTAPSHAYTAARGVDPKAIPKDTYPRDRRLIYAYARPVDVLINQNSFSNAEIFAHAVQTIGRGRLVGTATYGGVISTGSASLIDGTTVRTPFRGWYLPDGTDMENHGAQPDVAVLQEPQDEAAGRDRQLEAAVRDLLNRVPAQAAQRP